MRDEDLIKAFLHGDSGSFELLVSRYQRPVYYTVRAMVFDREEARDITQQAFIKVFNNLGRLKKRENFRGWLFKIAANLARDFLRRRRNEVDIEAHNIQSPEQDPEFSVVAGDLRDSLREAISVLPARQQQVVTLRALRGFGFDEISSLLGISPQTARANYHFALKKLRQIMRRQEFNP